MTRSCNEGRWFDEWFKRFAIALAAEHSVLPDQLIDGPDFWTSAIQAGVEPEAVASSLDAVDLALTRWVTKLRANSRKTYLGVLRIAARNAGFGGPRPVRAAIDLGLRQPDELERMLQESFEADGSKNGTIRTRLSAWSGVFKALFMARLAERPLSLTLPRKDEDTENAPVSCRAILLVDRQLAALKTCWALRLRALFHLAIDGLRTQELEKAQRADVSLQRRVIKVGQRSVRLSSSSADALKAWLGFRGQADGPLFLVIKRHTEALTAQSWKRRDFERALRKLSSEVGEEISVEALRRRGIADAPTLRAAQRFADASDVYRIRRHRAGESVAKGG